MRRGGAPRAIPVHIGQYRYRYLVWTLGMLGCGLILARIKNRRKGRRERPKEIDPKIWKTFVKVDKDEGGSVDAKELVTCFEELDRGVSVKQARRLIAQCGPLINHPDSKEAIVDDEGNCGEMDVYGFATLMATLEIKKPSEPFVNHSILGQNKPLPYQREVRRYYTNPLVVWSVAGIIIANFIVNILEKEYDQDLQQPKYTTLWETADLVFNILFLAELLWNMYGYGFGRLFWKSGWNVFDFFIVAVGILLTTGIDLGELQKLKLLRAFRVFRLFKRIKSLNRIIMALLASIPGVANAFVIVFIFFCIYAILGVELFREFGRLGYYRTSEITATDPYSNVSHVVDSTTARGYTRGIEYFGVYSRAMFTLFQIMTGEAWCEEIMRPLLFGLYQTRPFAVSLYFITCTILMQFVLSNVVVAVLLDNFAPTPPKLLTEAEVTEIIDDVQLYNKDFTQARIEELKLEQALGGATREQEAELRRLEEKLRHIVRGDLRRSPMPERSGSIIDAVELKPAASTVLPPPFSFSPGKATSEPTATRLFSQPPPPPPPPPPGQAAAIISGPSSLPSGQAAARTPPAQAAAATSPVTTSSSADKVAALDKHALLSRRVELLQEKLQNLDEKLGHVIGQLDQGLGFLSSMEA